MYNKSLLEKKRMTLTKLSKKVLKQESIVFVGLVAFALMVYFIMPLGNEHNANSWFFKWFWLIAGVILLATAVYFIICFIFSVKNRSCIPVKVADKTIKYGFLLKQLVARDFKRKYKRSVLGICWSFLNPLLMMGVQYVIFSTLFGNDSIKCYPVYLLIGVIFFSAATESCSTGLSSITDNGMLVKKVYVPKYIYPLSRVISAYINFALSLIPLLIIMACMRIVPNWAMLMFFPVTILLFIFCYGMALILGATMVFFRDIQFLWGIFTMLWMYGTPIFYSVDQIRSSAVQTLIKCNPLYHYITIIRATFIDGVCPDIKSLGFCVLFSVVVFVLGYAIFKKSQERFAFHV